MQLIKITLPDGTSFDTTIEDTALEDMKPKSNKRWRADRGEKYFLIYGDGDVSSTEDYRCIGDNQYYNMGNYYQTKEQAKKASDKQRAIVKINDRIDELNAGIEFENFHGYTVLNFEGGFEPVEICVSLYRMHLKYCVSEEIADQIIKELEPELRLVFEV